MPARYGQRLRRRRLAAFRQPAAFPVRQGVCLVAHAAFPHIADAGRPLGDGQTTDRQGRSRSGAVAVSNG
jgi:hypothetical protein